MRVAVQNTVVLELRVALVSPLLDGQSVSLDVHSGIFQSPTCLRAEATAHLDDFVPGRFPRYSSDAFREASAGSPSRTVRDHRA